MVKGFKFVLMGFVISVMESYVLGYKSFFYGRRMLFIMFKFLSFFYLRDFFLEKSWEEFVRIYGIIDGILVYFREV